MGIFSFPPLPPPTPGASQLWPILCQGAPPRQTYAGPPQIEALWHKAAEQGRLLESGINDAMFACQKEKADLTRAIQHYLDLIQTSTDAEFPLRPRRFKLAADVLNYISKISTFMNQIQALTQAIETNLTFLSATEAYLLSMIQNNLNAIANFMLQICNLGLPSLPSIPSFFGANIFTFNGFDFATLTSLPNISFSAFSNFSFAQCGLSSPAALPTTPPTIIVLDGVTVGAVAGTIVPPLGGQIGNPAQLTSPSYIAQLQAQTVTPIYDPTTVNPTTVLEGSLPDPVYIISNYQMPSQTYKANVLSTIPAFRPLITAQLPAAAAATEEGTLLAETVSLAGIVASGYDKNLTAAWLFYVEAARLGRGGAWLPNFEAAYQAYVQPSLTLLEATTTTIPWNTVIGGPGTADAPAHIPLLDTLNASTPGQAQHILWQLSYVEASLLGYPRTLRFDAAADSTYLSTFTGPDLDYVATGV